MKIEDFCENFFRKIVLYIIPLRGLRNEYITRKKSRDYCDIMFYNKKYILGPHPCFRHRFPKLLGIP